MSDTCNTTWTSSMGRIMTREIEEIERMQSKTLKQLLQVPISTSTAGALMETGIRSICNTVQWYYIIE